MMWIMINILGMMNHIKRGEGYSLESYNNISGSGFDVKMGLILRPFEYSPFRIGFAVHTPTFYKLTYSTSAIVTNRL